MAKPYSGSKADPAGARERIRKILQKFGVSRVGFDEDFETYEVIVRFKYNDYPVVLPVNYDILSQIYLDDDPYTHRKRCTEKEWEADKREIAYRASFSLLEDYLKSLITMVELGVFSFEELFLSSFVNRDGQRLGDVMIEALPDYISGQKALPE